MNLIKIYYFNKEMFELFQNSNIFQITYNIIVNSF